MNDLIRNYYEKAHTLPMILEKKIERFERNPDIKEEFENWIKTKQYKVDSAIMIEGYTAKSLAEISPYLNGEGAFILLVELREEPEKAMKRISEGFKRK